MRIAVLAVQGAFLEHEQRLSALGVSSFEIRQRRDLRESFDGLILPGGESTVMGKLLRDLELFDPLRARISEGLPVLGTCAGLLLLAKEIGNNENFTPCFATMDIAAHRNAYGRQLGSFHTSATFGLLGEIPMTFIRAPYIERVGSEVEILAQVRGKIVAARQGNQLVTAFHPELDPNFRVHEMFLGMI